MTRISCFNIQISDERRLLDADEEISRLTSIVKEAVPKTTEVTVLPLGVGEYRLMLEIYRGDDTFHGGKLGESLGKHGYEVKCS